ncbi:PREDICTED: venom acid phosphatase Acph-1-like [Nicrophorus vespilloides]|uniref:acid phosphatase n=1 Tax=Nicrophorus vespilloides TaxID=110193 RepID=A0ABM1N1K1_NICVS|nr:PREDICTED: venom acid phosphatase Acph-1-like [Nicrophorus vespilloides]
MSGVGKALKKRYGDFLGDVYYDGLLEAISSEYKRAMMSLQAVLASLFKPSKSHLKGDLNWQPVPFNYIPFAKDNLLATYITCPDIFNLQTDLDEDTQKLYTYLSKYSGLNITNSQELFTVYHNLRSLYELNLEVPDWVKRIWPQPIKNASQQFWEDIINQQLKKSAGSLLKKIHEDSQRKIDGSFKPKIVIYSGHDINIVSLMGAFKLFQKENIRYGSYVIVELHKIENDYYIKIIYENYNLSKPEVMHVPGCSEFCKFEKFVEVTKMFYPNENWCS